MVCKVVDSQTGDHYAAKLVCNASFRKELQMGNLEPSERKWKSLIVSKGPRAYMLFTATDLKRITSGL